METWEYRGKTFTNIASWSQCGANKLFELESKLYKANPGKNLFDKNNITKGYYLNTTGGVVTNPIYGISNYIPIEPSTNYFSTYLGVAYTCNIFYDENFNFISYFQSGAITSPSNAMYVRCTYQTTEIRYAKAQLEKGSVATLYEEYISDSTSYSRLLDLTNNNQCNMFYKVYSEYGKNLFDINTLQMGYYIDHRGIPIPTDYIIGVTEFIPLNGNNSIIVNKKGGEGSTNSCLYDKNFNCIESTLTSKGTNVVLTATKDAAYARFSINVGIFNNESLRTIQIEYGNVPTSFEPFFKVKTIEENITNLQKLPYCLLEKGVNLFDKNDVVLGFLNAEGIVDKTNNSYRTSNFIPVKPDSSYYVTEYSIGGSKGICFYANYGIFISYDNSGVMPITIPENAKYMRINTTITQIDTTMVVEGTLKPVSYIPYKQFVPDKNLPDWLSDLEIKRPQICLPSSLYFLKGKEFIIYTENILLKERNKHIQFLLTQTDLGQLYGDVFQGTPASAGNKVITGTMTDEDMKLVDITPIPCTVIDPTTKTGNAYNILCAGDSFSDVGIWIEETSSILTSLGIANTLIGTRGNRATMKAEGLSGGALNFIANKVAPARIVEVTGITIYPSTNYGGGGVYTTDNGITVNVIGHNINMTTGVGKMKFGVWRKEDNYLDNFLASGTLTKVSGNGDQIITYTNAIPANFNPFWNVTTNKLDFIQYVNTWGFAIPNIFVIQFGWNDTSLWQKDFTSMLDKIKKVVDQLHIDYPNCKVVYSVQPLGSLLPSNTDLDGKVFSLLNFEKALVEIFEKNSIYSSWFKISPSYMGVDRKLGYNVTDKVLSSRYPTVKTTVSSDIVHPNSNGYKQIADVVVPVILSF